MRRKHNYGPHGRFGDGGKVNYSRDYNLPASRYDSKGNLLPIHKAPGEIEEVKGGRQRFVDLRIDEMSRRDGGKVKGK